MKEHTTSHNSGVNWLAVALLSCFLSTSAWMGWVVVGGPAHKAMADEVEAAPEVYPAGPELGLNAVNSASQPPSIPPTYAPAPVAQAAYPTTPYAPLPPVESGPDAPSLPADFLPVGRSPYGQSVPLPYVASQPPVHAPLVVNLLFNGPETWQVQWSPQPLVGPYDLQGGQAYLPAHARVMKGKNYLLTFHSSDPAVEPRLWASLLISSETNRSRDFLKQRNLLIQWTEDDFQTADEKCPLTCVIYLPNADEDDLEPQQTKTLWSRDFPTEFQTLIQAAQLGEVVAVVKLGLSEEEKNKLLAEEK